MAVFRVEKTKDFTVMSNFHLRDVELSLKAKGLLSLMLSLPEDWDYTTKGLACICKDGVDSITSALKELENHGYLTRQRIRYENGRLGDITYTIHEQPVSQEEKKELPDQERPEQEKLKRENPRQVNPEQVELKQENPAQLNTEQSNTDGLNTYQSIYPAEPEAASCNDGMDRMELADAYRQIICENIEYDILAERHGKQRMDETVELMLEVILSKRPYIRIAGDDFPKEVVRSRFLKINSSHVEYVFGCIDKNTTKVGNIKAYLLTALYNAPATMDSYYRAAVTMTSMVHETGSYLKIKICRVEVSLNEYRVNDVDLQEFLHSFTDGDGKLPSDFDQLKREGHYLIHGDAERVFCLKEREIYLKDTMENLLARSICFFSNMPISYAVHVKASGRADITVLDNKRLAMEIKEKQTRGKSITVKYYDGTVDVGALKTEKYIKGPFGEKISTIQYACVADSLLQMSRKVYSLSYEAQNERSLSAAVREIHRKREHDLPVKTKGFFRAAMEDRKLLLAIRQTRYLQGMPDESRISQLKGLMRKEGYIPIAPELAVQAKKFAIPRYTLQKDGKISFAHDVKLGEKSSLFLIGKQWEKMLDILVNEKSVYCSKELLVAMKVEAKYEAANGKKKSEKTVFASIARKLTCFLEAVENHNLSHLLKENALKRELPDFLSADEKEKLTKMYRFPEKEHTIVADQSTRYQEAVAR